MAALAIFGIGVILLYPLLTFGLGELATAEGRAVAALLADGELAKLEAKGFSHAATLLTAPGTEVQLAQDPDFPDYRFYASREAALGQDLVWQADYSGAFASNPRLVSTTHDTLYKINLRVTWLGRLGRTRESHFSTYLAKMAPHAKS